MYKSHETISVVPHDKCTGCGACFNKCPVGAISMQTEDSGFKYPVITAANCISCGQCYTACPLDKVQVKRKQDIHIFSATAPKSIQQMSSSGGLFSLFADYVLSKGGVVCGAAYSSDYMHVNHIIISSEDDLQKLRGSKYVQSDTGTVMKELKTYLDSGRFVLFSGCPCQVAGFRSFLGKDYSNLILVDILCHGVPSPQVYRSFLEELANDRTITKVDFREKAHFGWGTATSVFFDDGTVYRGNYKEDKYFRGFLAGLITREGCSTCVFASPFTHMADITLGDFWGIKEVDASAYDKDGVSLIITNNHKGYTLFNHLIKHSRYSYKQQSTDKTIEVAKHANGQLLAPKKKHEKYKLFFQTFPHKGFNVAFDSAVNSLYDIGIVGWWNNENYGGALTYYSLYKALESMGFSVLMIRHIRWEAEREYKNSRIDHRFALKHYNISKNYEKEKLYLLNDHVKAFISGSDQLFNPWLWIYSGPEYFLSFVENRRKLISYASSFGNNYDINNPHHLEIAYNLHRFDALSVREDYGVDICKDSFGLQSTHVVDPVFLCDSRVFETLTRDVHNQEKQPYLVSYILDPSPEKRSLILRLKEKLNMSFVNLVDASDSEKKAKALNLPNTVNGIDVEEWVDYYMHSDFVITDSFHGTCFAIIFRKQFISLANPLRGVKRPESLLSSFGLLDRLVYNIDDIDSNYLLSTRIDYDSVYERYITPKVEFSKKWLYEAINSPKNAAIDLFKLIDDYWRHKK